MKAGWGGGWEVKGNLIEVSKSHSRRSKRQQATFAVVCLGGERLDSLHVSQSLTRAHEACATWQVKQGMICMGSR